MNYLYVLKDPAWWQALLGSDFNKGFMAALCMILALMIFLFLVRGFLFLIFRSRRCRNIEVKRADGNTLVSSEVIASVVERELEAYPAIRSEKIVLTRRGGKYQMTIYCSYLLADQTGVPAFCDEFKPRLTVALEKGFGITSLTSIRLWVKDFDSQEGSVGDNALESARKDAYIGL